MSDAEVLERVVTTKEAAHEAVSMAYEHAKALILNGDRVRITCGEDQDDISIKQRKFLHGPVLQQISEQARVGGQRFVREIWKEHLRRVILEAEPKFEMRRVPRIDPATGRLVLAKRATPYRIRRSTEDLSIKGYSEYIDNVLAYAATELGVADEREAVRYVRRARKMTP